MKHELFLGIDQGSSSAKGALLDQQGVLVAEWGTPVSELKREGRNVEQDPEGLLESVVSIFNQGHATAQNDGRPLRAWGLSVQRSGVLAWRADTGQVLHPMITWADTRTHLAVDAFGPGKERITNQTGLPVLANFAAPKIHRICNTKCVWVVGVDLTTTFFEVVWQSATGYSVEYAKQDATYAHV